MLQIERQQDILKILGERRSATVKELCNELYASPATIRRDLAALEEAGMLKRSFGGAVLNDIFPDQMPISMRASEHISEKRRIAAKAASLIHPGDTIFIDASTTTFYLAPFLHGIPEITVITNNPTLNLALSEYNIRNFSTGGEMLNSSAALVGTSAEKYINGIRAHSVFFSARGAGGGIATDSSKGERDIKISMIENSKRHYFLCDTSKLDKEFTYVVTSLDKVDIITTEDTTA